MDGWTKMTPLKTGFHPPEQCARGRSDCRSLHQLISQRENGVTGESFFCCGEVKPGASPRSADRWSLCIRGDSSCNDGLSSDVRIFMDRRDLSHTAAVAAAALAIAIPADEQWLEIIQSEKHD